MTKQKHNGIPAAPRVVNVFSEPMQNYEANIYKTTRLEAPHESHIKPEVSKPFAVRQMRSK